MTKSKLSILKTISIVSLVLGIFSSISCLEYRHKIYPQRKEKPKETLIVKPDTDDKTYTFKLSNGYTTSSRYSMTEKLVDRYLKHLNSCPVTLMMRTYDEYKEQYISKMVKKYDKYDSINDFAGSNVVGQHVRGWPVDGWPSYFIFVATRPNPHEMMATYFHELGHYKCNMKKCWHCKVHGHKHISEHHALINELESAIEYNFPEVMEAIFIRYNSWLSDYKSYKKYQVYGDAVLTVQASDVWKMVKKYAKEHKVKVPTYKKPKDSKQSRIIRIHFNFAA